MRIAPPKRSSHTRTLSLAAPPEKVFPLFSPILENEWVPDWDPDLAFTSDARFGETDLFSSQDAHPDAIWVVSRLDPDNHFVELLKIIPDHSVCQLKIQLEAAGTHRTNSTITCTCTAMGPEGSAFVTLFTERNFEAFMDKWEAVLNRGLATGKN